MPPSIMYIGKTEYSICAVQGRDFFNMNSFNIVSNTAWRTPGYQQLVYQLDKTKSLTVKHITLTGEAQTVIAGVTPQHVRREDGYCYHTYYADVNISVSFTGRILVGCEPTDWDIDNSPAAYNKSLDLVFKQGVLTKVFVLTYLARVMRRMEKERRAYKEWKRQEQRTYRNPIGKDYLHAMDKDKKDMLSKKKYILAMVGDSYDVWWLNEDGYFTKGILRH